VVATFPSCIAVNSDVWEPTYRELNETANRLAHRLADDGSEFERRAAILMSYDAPMVTAALGVLKAGQTVVPLDPGDPLPHLRMLAEDAELAFIIADAQNRSIGELRPRRRRPLRGGLARSALGWRLLTRTKWAAGFPWRSYCGSLAQGRLIK
jgi:non-ribosomal peptide synthetase component F